VGVAASAVGSGADAAMGGAETSFAPTWGCGWGQPRETRYLGSLARNWMARKNIFECGLDAVSGLTILHLNPQSDGYYANTGSMRGSHTHACCYRNPSCATHFSPWWLSEVSPRAMPACLALHGRLPVSNSPCRRPTPTLLRGLRPRNAMAALWHSARCRSSPRVAGAQAFYKNSRRRGTH
jgi:hypothetical protein